MSDKCCCGRYAVDAEGIRVNDTVHMPIGSFCGLWWKHEINRLEAENAALRKRLTDIDQLEAEIIADWDAFVDRNNERQRRIGRFAQ